MSIASFPALGFDPATGNVGAVRQIAQELSGAGRYAGEAHEVLRSIQQKRDVWTGEAAQGFVDKLGELPEFLDGAHRSLTGAGKALTTWSDRLQAHQKEALHLEDLARQAVADAQQADVQAAQARQTASTPITYSSDDPAAATAAQRQVSANRDAAVMATESATGAWDAVQRIRDRAKVLQDRWEDDAQLCIDALDDASDGAPDSGLFDDIGDAIKTAVDWTKDHLGDIAGIVSAIAGVLAFIPVLTPVMAPIAIGAGAVALGAHATEMVVEGKWDDPGAWVEIAGDAAGLIPGIGAVSKGIGVGVDTAVGAERVVDVGATTLSRIGDGALAGGRTFVSEMSAPSAAAEWVANRALGSVDAFGPLANNVAKGLEGSLTVGFQVPQATALADDSPQAQQAGDVGNYGASALSVLTAIPKMPL